MQPSDRSVGEFAEARSAGRWHLVVGLNYLLAAGAFAEITGTLWDITNHTLKRPETFFTPSHLVLYSGVLIVSIAAFLGLWTSSRITDGAELSSMRGLRVAALGAAIQLVAGPADFWWHSTFGFDPVLFSPPHIALALGMVVAALGAVVGTAGLWRLGEAASPASRKVREAFARRKPLTALFTLLGFTALWIDMALLIFAVTDIGGMRFQFHTFTGGFLDLGAPIDYSVNYGSLLIAGLAELLVLNSTSRVFGKFGAVTAVVLTFFAVVTFTTTLEFGVAGLLLPLAGLLLVPVIAFDYLLSGTPSRNRRILGNLILAPFSIMMLLPSSASRLEDLGLLGMTLALLTPYLLIALLAYRFSPKFVGFLEPTASALATKSSSEISGVPESPLR